MAVAGGGFGVWGVITSTRFHQSESLFSLLLFESWPFRSICTIIRLPEEKNITSYQEDIPYDRFDGFK